MDGAGTETGRDGQDWLADRYAGHAGFVAELGEPLLDLLDPRPAERILDLGRGDDATRPYS